MSEKPFEFAESLHTAWTTTLESPEGLQRKLTEQRMQGEQLRLLGSAIHVTPEGIAILTPAVEAVGPRIAFVNDGFCAMYGRRREDIIGETPQIFGIIERHQSIVDALLHHVFEHRPFEAEATARRANGTEFEVDLQLVPVEDAGQLTHWVAFLRDVTATKHQVTSLRHQAMHDALTGLPNRALLFDSLEKAIDAARQSDSMLALMLMDLDRFKEVNDTFGHQFGDALLKQVAFRLQNQMRGDDVVARLGGDEFAVVLPTSADANSSAITARRILGTLEQQFVIEGQVLEVGASIGIALFPEHGSDARTLLRRADVAMYTAKQKQTGYSFHREDADSSSADQLSLVVELRGAIERNELELYYQPKLHMQTGLMTRCEVLMRWNHPRRGLLVPNQFIPLAERTGLIRSLTDWLLDHALEQCSLWREEGAPIHVAVNISAKSLLDQSLPEKVQAALAKWGVDARFLKIEITESSIMADPAHALAILALLQSMGVRLSVDDFGTGYSSLTHLRELPIDEIKIDKSFVMGMATSDADAAIVRTVIDLAHNLGKQVCAEGVENETAWLTLRELGCDLAQGFWIARPMPAEELMRWLKRTSWGLEQ
ncbi:MAG TPA: EAL domain-containing protein [Thermoanaerobaculia bacterium]|jgi:diguanylate cyclase (GGDEF)-like protein/PAS domain S-box-containing protein|nr:EAL domain-containing protein [Thermoanaerobaculia bacterium]